MSFIQTLISFCVLILYILLGGLIFQNFEQNNEKTIRQDISQRYSELTQGANTIATSKDVESILNLSYEAQKYGIKNFQTANISSHQWNYVGSVYFSFIVVSTIGFGNLCPATFGGRAACIVYALFGIPICLNALNQFNELAKTFIHNIKNHLPMGGRKHHVIITALLMIACFLLIFVLPSIFISLYEKWTFKEGFYFSFITLTTIGFGDYVAGYQTNQVPIYKLILVLWMLMGLTFMAVLIAYLQVSMERVMKYLEKKRMKTNVIPTDKKMKKKSPENKELNF